jgi:hypothetical protein
MEWRKTARQERGVEDTLSDAVDRQGQHCVDASAKLALKSVFELPKNDLLQEAFVHAVSKHDRKFATALERAQSARIGSDLLGTLKTRLAALPPALGGVVLDLFQRLHRYQAAYYTAAEASVPRKCLLCGSKRAASRNPLFVAKPVHGYSYLRLLNRSV